MRRLWCGNQAERKRKVLQRIVVALKVILQRRAQEREHKVLSHLGLVEQAVNRLKRRFPDALSHMSHEDGGQYGILGLIDAVDTYSSSREI